MLLYTLGVRLLGNMLAYKRINIPGEGIIRVGYGFKRCSIKKDF